VSVRDVASPAEILAAVRQVAERHLEWQGEIREDEPLVEALRLDSVRLLTLVVEVENRFHVCLDDHEAHGIETVRDLVRAIRRELEKRAVHAD
jgi:acyl carrier protein